MVGKFSCMGSMNFGNFINTKMPLEPTRENKRQAKTYRLSQQVSPWGPKENNLCVCMAIKTWQLTLRLWKHERECWSVSRWLCCSWYRYKNMLTLPLPPCNDPFLTNLIAGKECKGLTFSKTPRAAWCRKGLRDENSKCDERYDREFHCCSNWGSGEV